MEKSRAKREAIQKTVVHCRSNPNLLFCKTAAIYGCLKQFISNHFHAESSMKLQPDTYSDQQQLTPAEEAALMKHINACYLSSFPLHVSHLDKFTNEILRSCGDLEPVRTNWHLKFFARNGQIQTKFSWPFAKA